MAEILGRSPPASERTPSVVLGEARAPVRSHACMRSDVRALRTCVEPFGSCRCACRR